MGFLGVTVVSAIHVSARHVFAVVTFGGFRAQSGRGVPEKKAGEFSIAFHHKFPVNPNTTCDSISVTLFEPSTYGDRHCGTCRVLWREVLRDAAGQWEGMVSLSGVGSGNAAVNLRFELNDGTAALGQPSPSSPQAKADVPRGPEGGDDDVIGLGYLAAKAKLTNGPDEPSLAPVPRLEPEREDGTGNAEKHISNVPLLKPSGLPIWLGDAADQATCKTTKTPEHISLQPVQESSEPSFKPSPSRAEEGRGHEPGRRSLLHATLMEEQQKQELKLFLKSVHLEHVYERLVEEGVTSVQALANVRSELFTKVGMRGTQIDLLRRQLKERPAAGAPSSADDGVSPSGLKSARGEATAALVAVEPAPQPTKESNEVFLRKLEGFRKTDGPTGTGAGNSKVSHDTHQLTHSEIFRLVLEGLGFQTHGVDLSVHTTASALSDWEFHVETTLTQAGLSKEDIQAVISELKKYPQFAEDSPEAGDNNQTYYVFTDLIGEGGASGTKSATGPSEGVTLAPILNNIGLSTVVDTLSANGVLTITNFQSATDEWLVQIGLTREQVRKIRVHLNSLHSNKGSASGAEPPPDDSADHQTKRHSLNDVRDVLASCHLEGFESRVIYELNAVTLDDIIKTNDNEYEEIGMTRTQAQSLKAAAHQKLLAQRKASEALLGLHLERKGSTPGLHSAHASHTLPLFDSYEDAYRFQTSGEHVQSIRHIDAEQGEEEGEEPILAIVVCADTEQASCVDPTLIQPTPDGKLVYTGKQFPYPLPRVTDDRPDIYYEKIKQEREQIQTAERLSHKEAMTQMPKGDAKATAGRWLKNIAHYTTHEVKWIAAKTEEGVRSVVKMYDVYGFKSAFKGLPGEPMAAFTCKCVFNSEGVRKCKIFLCKGTLCVLVTNSLTQVVHSTTEDIRFGIHFGEIVSIQHALVHGNAAMQIFTTTAFLQLMDIRDISGEFFKLWRGTACGTAFQRAYNFIDHLWREAVEVPRKDCLYYQARTVVILT